MSDDFTTAPAVPLDQVEWRVDSEPYERDNRTVCRWVPYLNAPIVARLLDEWVGPDGWSDRYEHGQLAGKEVLWCHLTIRGVTKSDVGVASNTEAQKGIVSDAFKRAATLKWGVGRNVYELPTLFATCGSRERNGKKYATETKESLPDLLRQLKARGFDADGGQLRDDEHTDSDDTDDTSQNVSAAELPPAEPFATQKQVNEFKRRLDGLPAEVVGTFTSWKSDQGFRQPYPLDIFEAMQDKLDALIQDAAR